MATMREEVVVRRETAPMNILIVDDEPTIREACGEVAQLTGMNATMVATAEEAIEVLENSAVDILLTDLMLPHTSGLELLKQVHDTHPNLPVIVLTQYGTIDSAVAAYQDALVGAARDVAMQATTRAQIEAERAQRLIEADAAQRLEASAAARVRQGITDSRAELTATESWIEQRDALLQLDAAALSADVALQRALGGGYESPQELKNTQSTATTTTP